ncbi:MAG: transglycosylase domain-containing protein [Gemmatimonadota bacterium]|nr:transglycosylase domain-containing protein [Gemmatimonadota bacterium]
MLWLFAVWPPPLWYRTHWPRETAFMTMRRNDQASAVTALLQPPSVPEQRGYEPVPLEQMAPVLPRAVIVAEDNNFLEHGGLDFQAIRYALGYPRASFSWSSPRDLWTMAGALVRSGTRDRRLRGGSTITQQLAKNLYLSPSRNPLRKLKEAVTAYRLEAALGKRRILELYLNVAELGDEVWGVEAASRRYWGTSASALSTAQGAALAATLPSPLSSNPSLAPARMQRRQRAIIRRLGRGGIAVPPPEARAEVTDTVSEATDSRSF